MANHKSTKKSIKQNAKRNLANRSRKNKIRTFVRKVEEAISSGNKTNAQEAFKIVQPELMIAARKNVLKLNTASRKISKLAKKIKEMAA